MTVRELRTVLADPKLPYATRGEIRMGLGLVMLNIGADPAGFRELEHAADELTTLPHKAVKAMINLALDDRAGAVAHAWDWLHRAEQDCGLRTMTLRTRWLAGQWTGLDEKYAALGRAYPDVRQVEIDRAAAEGAGSR